jgi:hypothetical protein
MHLFGGRSTRGDNDDDEEDDDGDTNNDSNATRFDPYRNNSPNNAGPRNAGINGCILTVNVQCSNRHFVDTMRMVPVPGTPYLLDK